MFNEEKTVEQMVLDTLCGDDAKHLVVGRID